MFVRQSIQEFKTVSDVVVVNDLDRNLSVS